MPEFDPRGAPSQNGAPLPALPGFALCERLGRGAVGVTYRAIREADGQELALKLLHPQLGARPSTPPRLEKLRRALPAIDHTHIARFQGIGAVPGTQVQYALCDWVRGEPITGHLLAEGISLRTIVDRFTELLSALAEAHRHGVLHLGLHPGNVLIELRPSGGRQLKLVDLGLGRLLKPDAPGGPYGTNAPQHLRYASPELLDGRDLDGRSDLFSVGALLYEVLAGSPAHPAESSDEVRSSVVHRDAAPPSARAPIRPVPRELEAVVMRALRRAPDDRFRSALEMAQALRASLELLAFRADLPLGPGFPIAPAPPTPVRATLPGEQLPSRFKVGLGLGLVAAAAAALVLLRTQRTPNAAERLEAARAAMTMGRHEQALELLPEQLAVGEPGLACARAEALRALSRADEAARWLEAVEAKRGSGLQCEPP